MTITSICPCDNSTLANFKAWAQAISNALAAMGWVQTADTGQVNWSTISAVPSSAYVYEVWRANDSLAAARPIFLLIRYGYSTSNPSIRVSVGGGSNGAGVLTNGFIGSSSAISGSDTNVNNRAGSFNCYFSGDAGEFRAMLWQSATSCCVFGVERSKDDQGVSTNEYVTLMSVGNTSFNASGFQQSLVGAVATPAESAPLTFASSSSPQTQNFQGSTAAVPFFPLIGRLGNPMLGFHSAARADVAEGAIVIVNAYDTDHTYIATKQSYLPTVIGYIGGSGSGGALLMRYE